VERNGESRLTSVPQLSPQIAQDLNEFPGRRPIGSLNRERPFNEVLRIALRQRLKACAGLLTRFSTGPSKATFLPLARSLIVLTEGLRRQLTFTIFRTSES
jgi:hypothetical protein